MILDGLRVIDRTDVKKVVADVEQVHLSTQGMNKGLVSHFVTSEERTIPRENALLIPRTIFDDANSNPVYLHDVVKVWVDTEDGLMYDLGILVDDEYGMVQLQYFNVDYIEEEIEGLFHALDDNIWVERVCSVWDDVSLSDIMGMMLDNYSHDITYQGVFNILSKYGIC